ncbi:MAG: hypothetical protein M0Z54_14375 [Thermaerobacter sp.]|nr:hypothetical protein [Thermaerobacter sp.]
MRRWQPRLALGPAGAVRTVVNEGVALDRLYTEPGHLWTRLAHQDLARVLIFLDHVEHLLVRDASALWALRSVFELVITGPETLLEVV